MSYKNTKNLNKGFSLIELLIVLVVISILTTIILTGIGGSTEKATDGVIRIEMGGLKNSGALYFINNTHYGKAEFPVTGVDTENSLTDNKDKGGKSFSDGLKSIYEKSNHKIDKSILKVDLGNNTFKITSWALAVKLTDKNSGVFCIDSDGFSFLYKDLTVPASAFDETNNPGKCKS